MSKPPHSQGAAASRSFLARVHDVTPSLGPAEQRLGELIADFPGELASYNASELAKLAGVSNATVTRFVRRLGYGSYEEARVHARAEFTTGSRSYIAPASDDPATGLGAFVTQDSRNLELTMAGIEAPQIDALAARLLASRKIWVIGFRAAAAFAAYLQWQLTQVSGQVVAIPGAGQTMGEHLASFHPDDTAIFFALRRRVAATDTMIAEILGRGTPLALITDEGVPPQRGPEWHLRCETRSPGPLFSHVAVMGLCNVLVNRTIALAAASGRQHLRQIERINESLAEL